MVTVSEFYRKRIKGRKKEELLEEYDKIQELVNKLNKEAMEKSFKLIDVRNKIAERVKALIEKDEILKRLNQEKEKLESELNALNKEIEKLQQRQMLLLKEAYKEG